MKTDIWMPLYIKEFLTEMTLHEADGHGVYLLLLIYLWRKGSIPKDLEKIKRITKTDNEPLLMEILSDCFTKTAEGYTHERTLEEKAKAQKNRAIRAANGRKGGRPKKSHAEIKEREEK